MVTTDTKAQIRKLYPHTPLMISHLPKQISSITSALYAGVCNIIPLKSRYLLTKQNRPRLRYSACAVAMLALLSFGSSEHSPLLMAGNPYHGEESLAELLAQKNNPNHRRSGMSLDMANADNAQNGYIQKASLSAKNMTVKIGQGETLRKALMNAGLERDAAQDIMNEVAGEYNLRELKAGQKLDVSLVPAIDNSTYQLASMSMKIDPIRTLKVTRDEDGSIDASLDEKEVTNITRAARVVMDGSVYTSADKAGLPDRVTARAIKLFSHAVDFQRDVDNGDKLEVMYESQETKDGYIAKTGEIIFARMIIGGKEQALYRFKNDDGSYEYYTEKGKSIRQGTGLLKTPVSFGRVTSGFGIRRHPIMGYTKMHKGVDFGAPTGTPIYAAADGVIEKAGRFSSYGNYLKIRHNSKLSTAYGHISRFASNIRPGTRVKQGQTVAYVGSTGRSTGPHLHYEVHVNGVAVNPRSVKYSADNNLNGKDLKRFQQFVQSTNQEYARRASGVNVASVKKDQSSSIE